MDRERERRIRDGYENWNRGDLEAILADMHPEIEFHGGGMVPGMPAVIRGRDGIAELFRTWWTEVWDGPLHEKIERVVELDDARVLVLISFTGKGAASGVEVSLRYAHLLTERDGLVYRIEGFADWDSALEKAGVTSAPR